MSVSLLNYTWLYASIDCDRVVLGMEQLNLHHIIFPEADQQIFGRYVFLLVSS